MKMKIRRCITALAITTIMVINMVPAMALDAMPVKAADQSFETKEGEFFAFLYSTRAGGREYMYNPWRTTYDNLKNDGPKATAALAARHLENMPEGKRCIDLTGISKAINDGQNNWLWWDGVDELGVLMEAFFKELKAKGAELDYLIDDMESGMSNWTFNHNAWKLPEVMSDPRYETEIRPLLVENGFEFYPNPDDKKTELHYIVSFTGHTSYLVWNTVMERRESDYYRTAFTNPALKYYPDLKSSNYGSTYKSGEYKTYDIAGHRGYLGGYTYGAGTYSAPVLYGRIGQICQKGRAPEGYLYETFPNNAYNSMMYAMSNGSASMIGAPGGNFMPWIGLKHWTDSKYHSSYYYDETMFHLAMMNADPFLMYNVGGVSEADDEEYFSGLLKEINEIVGTGKRKTLVNDQIKWDQRYVLTGLELEDKNIWRITPDLYTPGITMDNFLVDSKNMVFQVGNQVVDFPEGSKILDYKSNSPYGLWITTPKGTRPQEIRAAGIDIPGEQIKDASGQPGGYTVENTYKKYVPGQTKQLNEKEEEQTQTPAENQGAENTLSNIPAEKPSVDTTSIKGHWAERALNKAVKDGLIKGSDKGLEPDRNVTKAELITMMMRAIGEQNDQNAGPQWYSAAADKAVALGWTSYLGDIEWDINRAASAEMIANALKLDKKMAGKSFTDDAQINATGYLGAVKGCAELGIITGYPDGSFKPLNTITRAEAVVIIQRAYY